MYEPGAFDISSGFVRPTALAKYIQQLTGTNSCNHFLGNSQGWWERSSRLLYTLPNKIRSSGSGRHKEAPVLIIGKRGTLGQAFARGCQERELRYHLLSRQDCDIADSVSIERAIDRYKPWAIINAAGYVRVDDAEKETDICFRENTKGATNLAITCKQHGIKLLTFSSDLVFDGQKARPYVESDPVNPLNVYGSSKVKAEQVVLKHFPEALVIRTSAFFGPWDEYNFNYWVESSLSNGQPITVADDVHISPTYVPDLVHTSLDLLVDHERDIWHVANKGSLTWTDLAYEVADQLDLDHHLITAVPSSGMGWVAERPKYSVLSSEKCGIMPSLENALERYFEARKKSGIFVA
jgi:dTDP-4-dehydrorhamnose reductase